MAFASFQIVFQQITRYITRHINTHTHILLSWQKVFDAVDLWEQTEKRVSVFKRAISIITKGKLSRRELFWYEWQLIENVKWKIEFVSIILFIPFINYYLCRNKKRLLVSNQTLISFVGVQVWVSSYHRLVERKSMCLFHYDGHVCDGLCTKCEKWWSLCILVAYVYTNE